MSAELRLLGLVGSLRADSMNLRALQSLRQISPEMVSIEIFEGLGHLPLFNPDLDGETPPQQVLALREQVGKSDGLIIACPEYAHGIPGAFKNCLDWLVSSLEFPGKPVMLVNTSPGSFHAQAALREVLSTMSAQLIGESFVQLPLKGRPNTPEDVLSDPRLVALLNQGIQSFCQVIRQRKGHC